ncbi:hypothetical protein RU07_11720 [Agrobacterium tumefaciens]|uniref:Permuted papain-like amidase YaeF/Yiix C92 family enzyme n=1 Tax=Agrobacterium tumefaciens TaxID=358 RepID=A0A0D0KYL6_AGRTU|nr:hypothetical protein RU07_11720 [Agrobacterium tumefaciens]
MPYAVDFDRHGNEIYVPAITFPGDPPPGRIDASSLRPGDILVWYSADPDEIHTTIRELTTGAYSHAALYIGRGHVIDAGPDGIDETSVTDLMNDFEVANVLRWEGEHDISKAVVRAKSMRGQKYARLDAALLPLRRRAVKRRGKLRFFSKKDWFAALALFARRHRPPSNSTYCSQLIVECFAACGVYGDRDVVEAAVSPNDFLTEGHFSYKGYLSRKIEPSFHLFDVNAPLSRRERLTWRPSPRPSLLKVVASTIWRRN